MIRKPEAGNMSGNESDVPDRDTPYLAGADTGVSQSDLVKGFTAIPAVDPQPETIFPDIWAPPPGGFVGRANGWER